MKTDKHHMMYSITEPLNYINIAHTIILSKWNRILMTR